jgi:hypothetical protein
MTIEPMTFDEVKNVFRNALDKANTPTEFIQNILTMSSELGYNAGLNDAWETARKIGDNSQFTLEKMGFEIQDPYKNASWDVVCEYSASEAIAKIKEYEEKHKCKECKWDEFRDAQHPVGTPCDSCFEGKNFSPKVARACSILEDDCPYIIECEECEVHCSVERAKQKLKGDKDA